MIPKIAFSFWEGDQFTYLHYLTIYTFKQFNPDIRLIVYLSKAVDNLVRWSTHEHSLTYTNLIDVKSIINIPGVEIIEIDINKELKCDKELSPVWKSDIIRILKLYEHGGIYIDFDILFISKIPDYIFNIKEDMAFNTYHNIINNAFIVSHKESDLCKVLLDNILYKLFNNMDNGYQQFGPILITEMIKNKVYENNVYYIPNDQTCPYLWNEMNKLFFSNINQITQNTFCIHWYNGATESRNYCSIFTNDKELSNDIIFENLLLKIFNT